MHKGNWYFTHLLLSTFWGKLWWNFLIHVTILDFHRKNFTQPKPVPMYSSVKTTEEKLLTTPVVSSNDVAVTLTPRFKPKLFLLHCIVRNNFTQTALRLSLWGSQGSCVMFSLTLCALILTQRLARRLQWICWFKDMVLTSIFQVSFILLSLLDSRRHVMFLFCWFFIRWRLPLGRKLVSVRNSRTVQWI